MFKEEPLINDVLNNVLILKRKHEYFNNIILGRKQHNIIVKEVNTICKDFRLKEKNRERDTLYRRYFAMYLLVQNTKLTKTKIGKIFNRDHATVLNAMKQVKNLIETNDPFYLEAIEPIYKTFNGLDFLSFINKASIENIDGNSEKFIKEQIELLNKIKEETNKIIEIYKT